MSFIGTLMGGEASAMSSEYNASIARQNAAIAQQQGQAAMEAQQRTYRRAVGAGLAAYGASGVQSDSGSPLDVLADSARMAELDRLTIGYNAKLKAIGLEQNAVMDTMSAKTARTASYFQAADQAANAYMAGGAGKIPGFG
jgi:hypothetical protein